MATVIGPEYRDARLPTDVTDILPALSATRIRGSFILGFTVPSTRRPAPAETARRHRRGRASVAALLSFLVPGAGQLYNRQARLALAFGLPVLLLGLALVAVALGTAAGHALLPRLLDRRVIIGLLLLDAAVLGWRVASIIQAHRESAGTRPSRGGVVVTAGLVLAAILMHAAPAPYALKLLETLDAISAEGAEAGSGGVRDRFPWLTTESGEPIPERTPRVVAPDDTRTNVLLIGIDSGVGRDHALTDTMLVVSLDPGGVSAMVSIPRDLVGAPLPNGEPYPDKLNSLLTVADADPARYPYGGGIATLKATIGELLGVPIHYFAAVDLAGFSQVVNAVGGVEVVVERPIADPHSNLFLEPGPLWMDGELALRYVRSRYGEENDDFHRAARQQQVVAAIRSQLAEANLLAALPGLLDAVRNTIATDVPADAIPALAIDIQAIDMGTLRRVVIDPPEYVTPAISDTGAYVLVPDLERIRALGEELLGG